MSRFPGGHARGQRYAELHCHSAFSFLEGASSPEELVERACEVGLAALALTDTFDLGGMPRFAHAARELSVEGIVGAELIFDDDSHLIVLASDLKGYNNVCALITRARSHSVRGLPRLVFEDIAELNEGLVALSGCEKGAIPSALYRGDNQLAVKQLKKFCEIFPGRFFVEVGNHHITQEAIVARRLIELASSFGVDWVVTNSVRYATVEKRIVHDVLVCLKHQVTLANAGRRLRPNGSWYLRSPEEICHIWRENLTGVKNTLKVAELCRFRLGWLDPPLPAFSVSADVARSINLKLEDGDAPDLPAGNDLVRIEPLITNEVVTNQVITNEVVPDSIENPKEPSLKPAPRARETYAALLERLVFEGAAIRFSQFSEVHEKQLRHELSMINRLKLAPYFLIMWDIVRFARSQGIAVQGRGSAANSAVCYCLFITAVDPIAMDLLFERFLSEGRSEPPDIDLDIAHQERERVLQYVYEKYGRAHAAMVCEVITYRGRSAVRDAARVLGFSQEQADVLASLAHHSEARDVAARFAEGALSPLGFDLNDRRVRLLIKVVAGLHQLPRHRSIHVGGFVLSACPIGEIVPVEPASMEKRTVIQWDKDDIDLVGLIKIDLLGLGMLTMLQEGLKLVEKHRGQSIDIGRLDMKDPAIYDMLVQADTVGLFQVESRAQMNILPKLKPRCFYDIIVSIAIVRPGPIQGNIIHPYLRRRAGLEPVSYLHESLEPILKRTLGVPLFQEQGMKLAVTAAGFTASQADQLRKVMSHKRSVEKMAKLCGDLAEGMRKRGFNEEAIATITHQLRAFASYGFPESHAASFSLLVYASAYLKRYFAPEFFCAILNAQPMGFYSPASLVRDAARHNVTVLPVDLAHSQWNCVLEDKDGELALRIGLRYVDGLGGRARELLEAALAKGPFLSTEDVVARSGLCASDLKLLASAGAFESFLPGRRKALWRVLSLLKPKRSLPLIEALTGVGLYEEPVELPVMTEMEEVIADFRTMQLSCGRHPMSFYRSWASGKGILSCMALRNAMHGDDVMVAGGVICRQRPETAKGFAFLTLEDESGMANVVVNPRLFEAYRLVIMQAYFLRVHGRLQLEDGVCNVIATHFENLPPISDMVLPARNFH